MARITKNGRQAMPVGKHLTCPSCGAEWETEEGDAVTFARLSSLVMKTPCPCCGHYTELEAIAPPLSTVEIR